MSVIYKLFCKDENIKECYIGSTNNLHKRKTEHKSNCNNINSKQYNDKVYKFIRANDGFENFDFMILEQFETIINKNDLFKIEGQYIKNNNTNLNSIIAGRTLDEYYEDNKKEIKEKLKIYYQNNKKEKLEYARKYNKENKTQIAEKYRVKYEENKKEVAEKNKEKVECEFCKSLIRKDCLKRHKKTKKCLKVQNTNQI